MECVQNVQAWKGLKSSWSFLIGAKHPETAFLRGVLLFSESLISHGQVLCEKQGSQAQFLDFCEPQVLLCSGRDGEASGGLKLFRNTRLKMILFLFDNTESRSWCAVYETIRKGIKKEFLIHVQKG